MEDPIGHVQTSKVVKRDSIKISTAEYLHYHVAVNYLENTVSFYYKRLTFDARALSSMIHCRYYDLMFSTSYTL